MVSHIQNMTDNISFVIQERDVFKRQFLNLQQNYENKIRELSILKELGNTLRSKNIYDKNTLFWEQIKIIEKYAALEKISLMLLNEELNVLEIVAESDSGGPIRVPECLSFSEGPLEQVLMQKIPIIINNTPDDAFTAKQEDKPGGSLLYVPIMHGNKAIGVLSLSCGKAKSFDQNQTRFFSLIADHISTAVIIFRLYQQMLKEEKQRFLLSRFFSKAVTDKIFDSGSNLKLGGERKIVTVLFVDLCGFTSMFEELDQEKIVEILNTFFSLLTPIIFKHDGTLDKIMGDGILAFFGAPLSSSDDPFRAVRTAIDIIKALKSLNKDMDEKNWPPLKVSIGIDSGEVVAGYIGSEDHLNYTVIGDAVNVAQRLESIAGPGEILLSKRVLNEIGKDFLEENGLKSLIPLPAQILKGKEKPLEVYKLEI